MQIARRIVCCNCSRRSPIQVRFRFKRIKNNNIDFDRYFSKITIFSASFFSKRTPLKTEGKFYETVVSPATINGSEWLGVEIRVAEMRLRWVELGSMTFRSDERNRKNEREREGAGRRRGRW